MLALTSCMDAHPGMPYLTVLGTTLGPITRHRDTDRTTEILTVSRHICLITTNRAKSRKIAKCHIFYTPNYPILPCLSASFTSDLTLHIDTRWKSAIYASSKHNVHNVTHKSVKQKVSKSNKVSHHAYRTYLLVTDHLPWYGLIGPAGWISWRAMSPCVMPRRLTMARFAPPMNGASRTSRRSRQERVSRTQDCLHARKM